MIRALWLFAACVAVALGAPVPASAATVTVWFCGKINTDFTDTHASITQLDDDYLRDNTASDARGVKLVVTDNTTGLVVQDVWLPDASPACAPNLAMNTLHTYKVQLKSMAYLAGCEIDVLNNDTSNAPWTANPLLAWTPVAGQKTVTTALNDHWDVLVATSWALHRRSVGLVGQLYTFYLQTCPPIPGASCLNPANGKLYIDPTMVKQKFVPVHEFGHKIGQLKNGGQYANFAELATPDGVCVNLPGTDNVDKLYASKAASEGLAHYYTAVAFNDTTGANCEIQRSGDYDLSGAVQGTKNEKSPSCEGDPIQETWAPADFLGNHCLGVLEDRGTKLDWLRAYWDADHTYGMGTTTIFDLWDLADPNTWDDDGGGGSNDPQERFEAAATQLGLYAAWTSAAGTNGVR